MESVIVAANIIKAALSNIFYINTESDGSLNQQPSLQTLFQLIFLLSSSQKNQNNAGPHIMQIRTYAFSTQAHTIRLYSLTYAFSKPKSWCAKPADFCISYL